ncbi:MAG TPA: glycosyltransferase, partial [Ornithinibacter sp.]|nr:glycosyltransferase [Ornithinibacter sp.]
MKIAMVSEHASPLAALGEPDAGGQNVHVAELALGLAHLGHDVSVYTRRDAPDLPERVVMAKGVSVVHVPAGPEAHLPKDDLLPWMDDFADAMEQDWVQTGVPDVVHAHFWMSGLAATRAGRRQGVPVVQTFHALGSVKHRHQRDADTSPAERLRLERRLAATVDAIIATCSDEVDELAMMGVPTDHVRVVPCGVDTTRFTPMETVDGPTRVPRSELHRLLAVGRLVERKGFDLAVRALADLPDAELVVVGGPPSDQLHRDPEACRLRALASELGVGDRLVLTGQRRHDELPALYRSADVVLAVPWYEPFGITPLEAAACGRPLVGSAVGGLLDSVDPGITGLLIPPRDVTALVTAVRGLLDDPAAAARMGSVARARAVERFDWSVVAERTQRVLEAVVSGSAASPVARPGWLAEHMVEVEAGLHSLIGQSEVVTAWGRHLASTLVDGGRLLAAGNGGSAAEAQHLTAELVGRWCTDRRPLSAISLCAETSSLTAILNDYGPDEVFA